MKKQIIKTIMLICIVAAVLILVKDGSTPNQIMGITISGIGIYGVAVLVDWLIHTDYSYKPRADDLQQAKYLEAWERQRRINRQKKKNKKGRK